MGLFGMLKGRNEAHVAESTFEAEPKRETDVSVASDSDTLSLEARNEKEIAEHPDQTTHNAQIGVQKAEATTLVWSRNAVIATYAW